MTDAVLPWSTRLIETFAAQLLALVTFFLFPAIRYLYLRHLSTGEGAINLSYSPKYGFRLAAANQIGKRVLSDLRWSVLIRGLVPSTHGLALADDTKLLDRHDFFLFPHRDEILLSFQLLTKAGAVTLVHTDILARNPVQFPLGAGRSVICDFTAMVENPLNFNFRVAKRATINLDALIAECVPSAVGDRLEPRDWRRITSEPILAVTAVE